MILSWERSQLISSNNELRFGVNLNAFSGRLVRALFEKSLDIVNNCLLSQLETYTRVAYVLLSKMPAGNSVMRLKASDLRIVSLNADIAELVSNQDLHKKLCLCFNPSFIM